MILMLDTNIISDLMKHPQGKAAGRSSSAEDDELVTSIIVEAEILFGIEKDGSLRRARKWQELAAIVPVLPFEAPAQVAYARLRADLERQGGMIGANDLLIAAHALTLGAVLVTDNVREFGRVSGLRVENWLRDEPQVE